MSDSVEAVGRSQGRWRFDWLLPVLFRPRQVFAQIVSAGNANWRVPILVIVITALIEVVAAGSVKQAVAATGQMQLPPGFEYYSPEQQAQFTQAMSVTSSPVFVYLLPALAATVKVFAGWILVGGLLHLILTLLGARGEMGAMMNLVAWAAIPYAIRSIVRALAILLSQNLISSAGLSGFIPLQGTNSSIFLAAFLSLVDIYLIWNIVLLSIGARAGTGLSWLKVIIVVLAILLLVLAVQALLTFAVSKLSGLTIIRPFF